MIMIPNLIQNKDFWFYSVHYIVSFSVDDSMSSKDGYTR